MTDNPYRLPRTATPSRYVLSLEPDLDRAAFSGSCSATITVHERTSTIVCNAIELVIHSAELGDAAGDRACDVSLDTDHERATFTLDTPIEPGEYTLTTTFSGVLNDKLRGFYRSTFTDTAGAERSLATTQFESTNARRAFPCWDEPDLKAVFDVTLVVAEDLFAVSCGAEIASTPTDDGRRVVRFAPTMVMSTYLVAFVVGPLEATDPVFVGDTPIRIVHPIGKGHLTDFALDAAVFALEHFEQYFDIPYPGDKLDLLAIPDFAFGAMENLGAVTFREILLLLDPNRATQPEQQRAADVINHELAHMWFGDLVTMEWWEGIWLKEAFATFMELHCTDAWRPDWQRWVDFCLLRSAAFDVDALAETRPIEYPVVSPADAEGMYDLLTYEKGAAVVRMLEQFLGERSFRDGVRHYLTEHSYRSTQTTDLWDALEETSGQPVRAVMDSWIFQGGHPIVSCELVDDSRVRLSQRRFRYDGAEASELWGVPIVLRVFAGDETRTLPVLLLDQSQVVEIGPYDAVLVNADASGFYRVRYGADAADRLTRLPAGAVEPIERYGLIDDAWAATVSGTMDPADYLGLVLGFANEDDLSVWTRIVSTLGVIRHMLVDRDLPAFSRWTAALLRPVHDRLFRDGNAIDNDRARELRATVFGALGTIVQDEVVIARSRELLDDDRADPSLRAAAVGVVASVAGTDEFDDLVRRFREAATPQDERRFSFALAGVPGPNEFSRVLAMCTDGTIRTQDAPYLLGRALGHRELGPVAWTYVTENWELINERFPSNSIVRMLEGVRALSAEPLATDVAAFCAGHPVEQGAKTLSQHLERLEVNVGLRRRVADGVPRIVG